MTTGHNSVVTKDKYREPRPIRTYPVKAECAPMKGETVLLRPMNFLDVPALRVLGVFLKLAAEARNSEVVDDQPSDMSAVHSQRSGQAGRVMITEIIDNSPCLGSGGSRVSRTSTEVIPDLNLVEPVIRLGPGEDQPSRPSGSACTDGGTHGIDGQAGPSGPIRSNGTISLSGIC